ncbi:MAG: hypothetical protein Ta2D_12290 [Rickettsiales bacterium]|nr:MAG: hypothetical protein Ta2D_12290 [Rickettsiales bacterium]
MTDIEKVVDAETPPAVVDLHYNDGTPCSVPLNVFTNCLESIKNGNPSPEAYNIREVGRVVYDAFEDMVMKPDFVPNQESENLKYFMFSQNEKKKLYLDWYTSYAPRPGSNWREFDPLFILGPPPLEFPFQFLKREMNIHEEQMSIAKPQFKRMQEQMWKAAQGVQTGEQIFSQFNQAEEQIQMVQQRFNYAYAQYGAQLQAQMQAELSQLNQQMEPQVSTSETQLAPPSSQSDKETEQTRSAKPQYEPQQQPQPPQAQFNQQPQQVQTQAEYQQPEQRQMSLSEFNKVNAEFLSTCTSVGAGDPAPLFLSQFNKQPQQAQKIEQARSVPEPQTQAEYQQPEQLEQPQQAQPQKQVRRLPETQYQSQYQSQEQFQGIGEEGEQNHYRKRFRLKVLVKESSYKTPEM